MYTDTDADGTSNNDGECGDIDDDIISSCDDDNDDINYVRQNRDRCRRATHLQRSGKKRHIVPHSAPLLTFTYFNNSNTVQNHNSNTAHMHNKLIDFFDYFRMGNEIVSNMTFNQQQWTTCKLTRLYGPLNTTTHQSWLPYPHYYHEILLEGSTIPLASPIPYQIYTTHIATKYPDIYQMVITYLDNMPDTDTDNVSPYAYSDKHIHPNMFNIPDKLTLGNQERSSVSDNAMQNYIIMLYWKIRQQDVTIEQYNDLVEMLENAVV